MREVFGQYGFQITCVEREIDAVTEMKAQKHRVVLLDYQLPLVNGDHLIAVLQEANPNARFIIITGLINQDIEEKFKGLGYYAFFEKAHIDVDKLRTKVMEAFDY